MTVFEKFIVMTLKEFEDVKYLINTAIEFAENIPSLPYAKSEAIERLNKAKKILEQ